MQEATTEASVEHDAGGTITDAAAGDVALGAPCAAALMVCVPPSRCPDQ
ncbi:MAG TPA: hypothetical protein VIJ22_07950 [Polyangiaceae bacterium]